MQLKKEIFTDPEDPNYWYAKGYDLDGNLIWSLEFGFGMHYKLFTTFKYNQNKNLIEEIVERSEYGSDLWVVDAHLNYEYLEHKYEDQLKIRETEYFTEAKSRRLIKVEESKISVPDPLYPDERNYKILGKKEETNIQWRGNIAKKYIRTVRFSQNGNVSDVYERIHEQEDLKVTISHKLNGKLYLEEEYFHEDTMSSIILTQENKRANDDDENFYSSISYKYDYKDNLVESVLEKQFYDLDGYSEIDRELKITTSFQNDKPVKEKIEQFFKTVLKDYEYNRDGKIKSFLISELNGELLDKKIKLLFHYTESRTIIFLNIHDIDYSSKFNLKDFIELNGEFYDIDLLSEKELTDDDGPVTRIESYLESDELEICIDYEYGFISEIKLSDNKTGKVLKKTLFLNKFIFDDKGIPLIKSRDEVIIEPNFDTYVLPLNQYEYYNE